MRRVVIASLLAAVAAWSPAVHALPAVTAAPSPAASDCAPTANLAAAPDWCGGRSGFDGGDAHAVSKRTGFGEKPGSFAAFMNRLGLEANDVVYTQSNRNPALGRAGEAEAKAETPAILPEPATWVMLLLGFGAIGAFVRRRFRKSEERFNQRIRSIEAGETL